MKADEIIKRIESTNEKTPLQEWQRIEADILKFLSEDHPESEKEIFAPLGYLEMVEMMCDTSSEGK